MTNRIHVVGAGVIGLTTGLVLQRAGYQVKILAACSPSFQSSHIDYTSTKAGAHWRSTAGQDKRQQGINRLQSE